MFFTLRSQVSYFELRKYIEQFSFPKASVSLKDLFTDNAIKNNLKKAGKFTCTGSEFLALAPLFHRYFTMVRSREPADVQPYIDCMLAVLETVILLQSVRTGTVTPDELRASIMKHLKLFKATWGDKLIRPKHHYASHLADMLERFGFLLASFVHERKHRLINKYGRDRKKAQNWDSGLIEDITVHQLWELQQPFYFAAKEATPRGLVRDIVIDLFPQIAPDAISLLSEVSVNGGKTSSGDVVAFFEGEHIRVGRLLLVVGIKSTTSSSAAFISKWAQVSMKDHWLTCRMSDDNVIQVETTCLDTVLIHTSTAPTMCEVFVPPELRV